MSVIYRIVRYESNDEQALKEQIEKSIHGTVRHSNVTISAVTLPMILEVDAIGKDQVTLCRAFQILQDMENLGKFPL